MNSPRVPGHELIQRIGAGGMAQVWMARRRGREGMSKVVALKFPTSDQEETLLLFAREARLSALLSHSNIVQVFDVGETDEGRPYLVMEWVDGLNLAQLISGWRRAKFVLPLGVCTFIVEQLLKALDYAHNLRNESGPLQIVHRDISPQNVLVSVSGEVKLTDFGIARATLDETAGVIVRGKLRYMPAEQLLGRRVDKTADLYAVGAILWELLAGRPFRGEAGEEALYAAALSGEVQAVERSDMPSLLEELLRGLLALEPSQRIANAKEALNLLHRSPQDPAAAGLLESSCRSLIGVHGPRSGIVLAVADGASRPVAEGKPPAPAPAPIENREFVGATPAPSRSAIVPSQPTAADRGLGPAIGGDAVVADATQTLAAPMAQAPTLVQVPARGSALFLSAAAGQNAPSLALTDRASDRLGRAEFAREQDATVTRLRSASASQSGTSPDGPAQAFGNGPRYEAVDATPSSAAERGPASSSSANVAVATSESRRLSVSATAPGAGSKPAGISGPRWLASLLIGASGLAALLLAYSFIGPRPGGTTAGGELGEANAPGAAPRPSGVLTESGNTIPVTDAVAIDRSGTTQAQSDDMAQPAVTFPDGLPMLSTRPPGGELATAKEGEIAANPAEHEDSAEPTASRPGSAPTGTKSGAARLDVTLSNGDFRTAYVRIGKREYVLEPRLSVQLSVGKHRFSVRASPEEAWASAGTVELSKGKSYKLIMRNDPPHVEVVEL